MCGHRLKKQKRSRREAENRVFAPASFERSPALQKTKGTPDSFSKAEVSPASLNRSPASFKRIFSKEVTHAFNVLRFNLYIINNAYASDAKQMIANNVFVERHGIYWCSHFTTTPSYKHGPMAPRRARFAPVRGSITLPRHASSTIDRR